MTTLPSLYFKTLRKRGIKAVPFAILRGTASSEFNNRSHRKMTIVDGEIGYTGGVNIADEYINKINRFGHWKDSGIRITGDAVKELTYLFLSDYEFNSLAPISDFSAYLNLDFENSIADNCPQALVERVQKTKNIKALTAPVVASAENCVNNGFVVPFSDGPSPIYPTAVAKTAFLNIINQAQNYVHITSPYLIIDNEIASALESAAQRGVEVKIITPYRPDKKVVQLISRSYYPRLIKRGVQIFEYLPGFIHAKGIVADDKIAIVGTINLDYRSFVHHFENGIWMYKTSAVVDIEADFAKTLSVCKYISPADCRQNPFQRFICSLVRVFAPLL